MKKIQYLFGAFLLCVIFLTACGKVDGIDGNRTENAEEGSVDAGEDVPPSGQGQTGSTKEELSAEEKLLEEQKKSYADAIGALDDMLAESRRREQMDDHIWE